MIKKCYRSATQSFINQLWTPIATKQHTRNFLGVQEPAFVLFNDFFFEFLTPFTLGVRNFFISNSFLTIVCVLDVPREEI
jgi:hypothetical protein